MMSICKIMMIVGGFLVVVVGIVYVMFLCVDYCVIEDVGIGDLVVFVVVVFVGNDYVV